MEFRPARLTSPWLLLLAAGLILLGSVGAWQLDRTRVEARRRLAFQRADHARELALAASIRKVEDAVSFTARTSAAAGTGGVRLIGAVDEAPVAPGDRAAAVAALRLAEDRFDAQFSAPLADGRVLAAAARFRSGADVSTTAGRRAAVDGWAISLVDPGELLAAAYEPAVDPAVDVELSDGDAPLVHTGRGGLADRAGAITRVIPAGGRHWVLVSAPATAFDRPPASAWAILAAGASLALFVAGAAIQADRLRRRAAHAALARGREVALIAELGPILQQSLDLSDILPSVTVRLAEEFDCDRVGVGLVDDEGDLVELFSLGPSAAPPPAAAELGPPPPTVAPGEEVIIPLQRAGRTIGSLRMHSRAGLDDQRMSSVLAASELLAGSVANARLFQREQEMVRRLQDVDELKTSFLGTASHELRTPVAAIRGFGELLDERWEQLSDAQRRDFVGRIARNAASLAGLVQDLLDFARLERGSLRVHPVPIDLCAVVRAVADELATLTQKHDIVLQLGGEVTAHADPEAISRVFSNLLSNATKFAPEGTAVVVTVERLGDLAALTVDDAGPGVPDAERERVFSRFYRGGSEAVLRTRGAGIGLAVVRDLVVRMDGTVTLGRSPSGGARFQVLLPGAPPEPEEGADAPVP